MKKQYKTYILLGVVLIIWGMIGYQVYTRANPPVPELEKLSGQGNFQKKQPQEISFYTLKATYTDPFLGKFPKNEKAIQKQISKHTSNTFPNVIYNGVIQGNKKRSYILTINGKQTILKIGKSSRKVRLIKANEKQVSVKFENQVKTISKD